MISPGRELDALVAQHVMGCKTIPNMHQPDGPKNCCGCDDKKHWTWFGGYEVPGVPHYSTSIAAAWEVFEKVSSLGSVFKDTTPFYAVGLGDTGEIIRGVSVPHVIYLAALKAVGVDV